MQNTSQNTIFGVFVEREATVAMCDWLTWPGTGSLLGTLGVPGELATPPESLGLKPNNKQNGCFFLKTLDSSRVLVGTRSTYRCWDPIAKHIFKSRCWRHFDS